MVAWPKISIVTPSFNQGQFIEQTILSVLGQNYPNLEYIIIDGGSSDRTIDIIKKYENHLKYWVSEPDQGQSDAINKGIAHCTGDIFNWLNSDDILISGSLNKIAHAFNIPETDIVTGQEIFVYENGQEIYKKGSLIYPTLEETVYNGVIYQPSTYWNLDVLRSLLPLSENLHYLMDADLWMRYLLLHGQGRIKKIPDNLVRFRLHASSKTVSSKGNFLKQRWFLRKQLLLDLDIFQDELSDIISGLSDDQNGLRPYKIKAPLNPAILELICMLDLLEITYLNYEYSRSTQILNRIIEKKGMTNRKLWPYWVKLNFIPKLVLNAARKYSA